MSLPRTLLSCLIVTAVVSVGAQRGGGITLFEGARLIVGDDSAPIENSAFIITRDKITRVGKKGELPLPAGATRVDLTGKTVMPALIDGHNHIGLVNMRDGTNRKENYTRENLLDQLQRYAYYGTAAALSMGLEQDQAVSYKLRDDFNAGMSIPNAARYYTVGRGIAATPMAGPPGDARLGIPYGAATVEEGLKDVAELKSHNVHFVKIWVDDRIGTVPKVQPEVYRAIIEQAHKNGQQVLAHIGQSSALADAKDLLKARVDGFVHVVRDRDVDDEYIALVKAHPRTWTGPNMPGPPQTLDDVNSLAETIPFAQGDRNRKALDARVAAGNNRPSDLYLLECRNFRKIHDAGMIIGLGTDGTGDGFGPQEQLSTYTGCGMTPREAIIAGTSVNARILGMDQLGTVAAGKEASFIVLDANPLENILNTRKISSFYLRGQMVDRQGLRTRWQNAPAPSPLPGEE
jgi:imidazolonepropionase-like amidohydrolase